MFSDTVEFLHEYLTQSMVREGDRIVHALNFLSCAIKYSPATIHHKQFTAISNLRDIFTNWIPNPATPPTMSPVPSAATSPAPPTTPSNHVVLSRSLHDVLFKKPVPSFADLHPRVVPTQRVALLPPRVAMPHPGVAAPPPKVVPIDVADKTDEPAAHRTRSRVSALSASSRTFPPDFIE